MNDALASLAVVIIGAIALNLVFLEILFQVSCLGLLFQAGRTSGLSYGAWALIIGFLPVVGGMLYLSLGSYDAAGTRRGPVSDRTAMLGLGAGGRSPRKLRAKGANQGELA
jgi:hypothetical protein